VRSDIPNRHPFLDQGLALRHLARLKMAVHVDRWSTSEGQPADVSLHSICTTEPPAPATSRNKAIDMEEPAMVNVSAPGTNVAVLRKSAGMSQVALARRAGISHSLLSKIEIGDRTLSPGVAAAVARALRVPIERINEPFDPEDGLAELEALRATVRRYDVPDDVHIDPERLQQDAQRMIEMRCRADIRGIMGMITRLLSEATAHAHRTDDPQAWALVADVYSTVYWLAARHRWMDLVEVAPERQMWAAAQRNDPVAAALAARDRAGTFLNTGDFDGGMTIVDRGIVMAESSLNGIDKAYALGILHLRGMTLAGRLKAKDEANRHLDGAWSAAEEFPDGDVDWHGLHFGPFNTASHAMATDVDMNQYRRALRTADDLSRDLSRTPNALPPTRIGLVHMNTARAKLAMGDRDGAVESLAEAWDVTPQMMRVHPTALEVLRVLVSLHQRSNEVLAGLMRDAGLKP
jgi:transcriptional regulator with XRE-family HTH domain